MRKKHPKSKKFDTGSSYWNKMMSHDKSYMKLTSMDTP